MNARHFGTGALPGLVLRISAAIVVVAEDPFDDVGTLQDPLLVACHGHAVVDRLNFGKK